jgi:uncharacterized membrane protein
MNPPSLPGAAAQQRMVFIDALRGLVIILMALDHVRDFFGPAPFGALDLAHTTPAWFLTRYVTHFCAPVFIFLAGTSAWLYGQNVTPRELTRYLLMRGLWLVFLEISVNSLSWGALLVGNVVLQVLWALGVSMIVLAGLAKLPRPLILAFALALIGGHNLLDGWHASDFGPWRWVWLLLHEQGFLASGIGKSGVFVFYPLLPWLGVMALGYWAAPLLQTDASVRQRRLLLAGAALLLLMLALRLGNWYGDPQPWSQQARGDVFSLMSLINFQKYPPSLLYLCVTLGLGAWLLALMARIPPARLQWLLVYGRVPMFFYLVHMPLIHIGAHVWAWCRYGQLAAWNMSGAKAPPDYEPSLLFVYGVWGLYLFGLYFLCRWYGEVKRRRPGGWLRYL